MSRKRAGKICPKCHKACYFEEKPTRSTRSKKYKYYLYAVHFNKGKRTSHYIRPITKPVEQEIEIPNDEFEELKDSTNDIIPKLAKHDYNLSMNQLNQLSRTEQEEYFEARGKWIKEKRSELDKIIKRDQEKMKMLGLYREKGLRKRKKSS